MLTTLWHTCTLLLPALIPSWRFFDVIAPSPRIEFTTLDTPTETATNWHEYQPRPASLSGWQIVKRLFYNPHWNENLFLMSCAERLMANPTDHSIREIERRILTNLQNKHQHYLQFRLVFLYPQGTDIEQHVTFTSEPIAIGESTQP